VVRELPWSVFKLLAWHCITHNEALQALHILRRYKEENVTESDSDRDFLRNLRAEERDIISKQHGSKIQCTLESLFTSGVR
jgi:hypothetical protein